MKTYRLVHHQRSHYPDADLLLSPKEHPNLKKGDIVEIFHPEDDEDNKQQQRCRLLLQVSFAKDSQGRLDFVSVESSIALTFNLKNYGDVCMQRVDPSSVSLDSCEITFKDQYMGRSEMWRLKQHLSNSCVYVNKKIEFCESIRCQVYEMWSFGERVACGVITEDTKVVFRSSTSMVYLFLQMSSEMWSFDLFGDLYFEKAVNGFLTELFAKWKKQGSNHEVTIVLFSRTFYAAKSIDEFPEYMKDCLQMDYKGRFYEDFYRVAIQNERCDDWSTSLIQLRKLFTTYEDTVLKYHERPGIKIPQATNSTAAQGNFLEVLNISLNVFEKHYLDRSFDRTGQLSVVLTPGVGVFEVDRELTNITKQRILDHGVGSDLVCVGEQPFHAVPLLKFHNKDPSLSTVDDCLNRHSKLHHLEELFSVDDYSMPHWINLSFYSTSKKVAYSTFVPRIKLPPLLKKENAEAAKDCKLKKRRDEINFYIDTNTEYIHNSIYDYDAYDSQVFANPTHSMIVQRTSARTKKTSVPSLDGFNDYSMSVSAAKDWENVATKRHVRKLSDPDIHHSIKNSSDVQSSTIRESMSQLSLSATKSRKTIPLRTGRALINPFDPSHVTIKLTSNRRRWSHIFPKGPTGVLIQQHHYQAVPSQNNHNAQLIRDDSFNLTNYDDSYMHTSVCMGRRQHSSLSTRSFEKFDEDFGRSSANNTPVDRGSYLNESALLKNREMSNIFKNSPCGAPPVTSTPSKILLWGATGEQDWTPTITTGVDWKSLTIPACLPITTDFFPDKRSLNNDYVLSIYTLIPSAVNQDFMRLRAVQRRPLSTEEVFKELVSQRLAQGFQLIILNDSTNTVNKSLTAPCCGGTIQAKPSVVAPMSVEQSKEYLLSIGRIFHKISLNGSEIKITRYRPRHPYLSILVDYRYRFHAPNHDNYEMSGVTFTTEKLENYNWNHMDHYICTRGDFDFMFCEQMKYWRYRMYLLPKEDHCMRQIIDENLEHCDIYKRETSQSIQKLQVEEFLRFVETHLNKIKRVKKPKGSPTTSHLTKRRHSTSAAHSLMQSRPPVNQALQNSSPFRERVGSNRERLRPSANVSNRSGSKIETKSQLMQLQATLAEKNGKGENEDDDCFVPEPQKFKVTSPLNEIFEAFKNPTSGVGFLEALPSMPSMAFSSFDAIMWVYNRVEGATNPLEILEAMREKGYIAHASGDTRFPIVSGFYMYYITSQDKTSADYRPPLGDNEAFSFEWMEVEIPLNFIIPPKPQQNSTPTENDVPSFLKDSIPLKNIDGKLYKVSHLEVDLTQKVTDRVEFGHARYHKHFIPTNAFEIVVQWLVASGPIVYDLIYNWSRKAQQCGFQLVPIPCDPLAESFSQFEKSDPLRGPIFISLNIECLLQNRNHLFEDFKKETWNDRMLLFQDEIVKRFGFITRECETKTGSNDISPDSQYIHVSGHVFVSVVAASSRTRHTMRRLGLGIGQTNGSPANSLKSQKRLKNYYHTQQQSSVPQKENYINRHVQNTSGKDSDDEEGLLGMNRKHTNGFLWQWNHMIPNKKWKSYIINGTDELFQQRMLRDFKEFCMNADGRLLKFWDESWQEKEKLSLLNSS